MSRYIAIAAGLLLLMGAAGIGLAQQQSGQESRMGQEQQPGMSQQQPGQQQQEQQMGESSTAGGGQAVALGEVVPMEGKVVKINKHHRTVTLEGPQGNEITLKADRKARHFEHLKVGDEVKAQYFQGVVLGVSEKQSQPGAEMERVTIQSRGGQSPSELEMRTVTMQAKVDSVDQDKHTVTLTGPEGRSQTFKVHQNVQLNQLKPGETINARYIEGVAVELEKK